MKEITAQVVLILSRKVEERGHHETARRLKSVVGECFRYAIATGRAETDPTYALRRLSYAESEASRCFDRARKVRGLLRN